MKALGWCSLVLLIAASMACGPVADGDNDDKEEAASSQSQEPVKDPTEDVEKDEVDLDNLDKPLIEDKD